MPNPGVEKTNKKTDNIKLSGVFLDGKLPKGGWTIKNSTGTSVFGVSNKNPHSGSYCLYSGIKTKNPKGVSEFFIRLGENIPGIKTPASVLLLKPDTTYYFSFWIRAEGKIRVILRYEEHEKNAATSKLKYIGLNNKAMVIYPDEKWKKYETVFTTSSRMIKAVPVLQVVGKDFSQEGNTVFIDDVEIIPFDEKCL
jgi:hypothetical protein